MESRKREALVLLALHSAPYEAHKALWNTLDVGYFMRHDATDIAWHTKHLSRHPNFLRAVPREESPGHSGPVGNTWVRARLSPTGDGLQVVVYTPDQSDLFVRICGYFDQAGFGIVDAKIHTANNGYALDTFQVVNANMQDYHHELSSMVETDLLACLRADGPLPAPSKGRVSRRVKSFPMVPRIDLQPDEKAQRWLLSISASDRVGLLYSVARVLAKHRLNLHLAKVTTLGERVEDTFLIDGPELQHNRAQIDIETELLAALG